jgi:hypothetical protein
VAQHLELGAVALHLVAPEGRARAAEAAVDVIREHPNSLVRDQYLMDVAGPTRVEPAQLRAMLEGPSRGSVTTAPTGPALRRDEVERDSPELEVLRHVLHDWPSVEHWIRYDDLFERDLHAMAFRALMAHPTVPEAIEAADAAVAELLARLAAEEVDSDPFDAVTRLLTERAKREAQSLVPRVNAEPELQAEVQWLMQCQHQLSDPASAADAADQLVAWLGSRGEGGE